MMVKFESTQSGEVWVNASQVRSFYSLGAQTRIILGDRAEVFVDESLEAVATKLNDALMTFAHHHS